MPHLITQDQIDELDNYEFTHQICGAFGKGDHKELIARVKGSNVQYEVWSKKELVHQSGMLVSAADAYNAA